MDNVTDLLADLDSDVTAEAGERFLRLVARYFASTRAGEGAVSTPHAPDELARRFDEPLPQRSRPLAEVVERLERDVLSDSNRVCHPRSLGHQVSAPLPAAVWTEAVIGALNQSAAVWEMSPVGTIIETQIIRWMCGLAGLGEAAGGTFTSGGTEATFAALLAARAKAIPDAWDRGMSADGTAVVCGEHAHYGVARAVGELGFGTNNIVVVPSRHYHLDVSALERRLDELQDAGRRVIAVVATSGTTATGSFDDLDSIGHLCERHGVWLHVDAAHGGSALLSEKHRWRVKGIERAQSVAWDPHKMMLLPLTASMLLVADESALQAAYSQRAPYLFHKNSHGRAWDQGLRTFQCSRRVDALKVWVALQRYGTEQLGALYDRLCATAQTLFDMIKRRPEFVACNEPESNIVCFRYVGIGEQGSGDSGRVKEVNQDLRERFNRSGEGWITTTVLDGRRVLRVTVMNPRTTDDDLTRVLDGLAAIGSTLLGTENSRTDNSGSILLNSEL